MKILVLSGSDRIRFPTMINHQIYSDIHGYTYRFDLTPSRNIQNVYFHKIRKIASALLDTDWLFWLDDDAAFTRLEQPLNEIAPDLVNPDIDLIFCKGPTNPQGGWTHLSSGNFFVRNSARTRALMAETTEGVLKSAEAWWDKDRFGMFTGGDQDALVYLIENSSCLKNSTSILNYTAFNTRSYHYNSAEDHFLVHFTYQPGVSKADQMKEFARQHGLSAFLVPAERLSPYGHYPETLLAMIGEDQWRL